MARPRDLNNDLSDLASALRRLVAEHGAPNTFYLWDVLREWPGLHGPSPMQLGVLGARFTSEIEKRTNDRYVVRVGEAPKLLVRYFPRAAKDPSQFYLEPTGGA